MNFFFLITTTVGGCFRRDSNLERIGIFEIQSFSKFLLCSSEIILLDDFFESASAEILSPRSCLFIESVIWENFLLLHSC
jgi:hypothetical protein